MYALFYLLEMSSNLTELTVHSWQIARLDVCLLCIFFAKRTYLISKLSFILFNSFNVIWSNYSSKLSISRWRKPIYQHASDDKLFFSFTSKTMEWRITTKKSIDKKMSYCNFKGTAKIFDYWLFIWFEMPSNGLKYFSVLTSK